MIKLERYKLLTKIILCLFFELVIAFNSFLSYRVFGFSSLEPYFKPWNFNLRLGYVNYGDFIDDRFLYVLLIEHYGEKANSAFCYTRTNTDFTNSLPFSYDFSENLFSFRISRRHRNKGLAQIHLLLFQNNDWLTDNGWLFGLRYDFKVSNIPPTVGYEVNTLNFVDLNIMQNTFNLCYKLNNFWKLEPGVNISFIQNAEAGRVETRTPAAVYSKLRYEDYNFLMQIQFFSGKRIFFYDSDLLYSPMNNSDSYNSGFNVKLLQKARYIDLYSEYGIYSAFSKYLRSSKQPFWHSIDIHYTLKLFSVGLNLKF